MNAKLNDFNRKVSLDIISLYRDEVMGFSILGVMVAHFITISGVPHNSLISIINIIATSIFTRGFLFMSGLGQFNSYIKSGSEWMYYRKRIKRLFIPFVLISFPFFVILDLLYNNSLAYFLGHISAVSFWIDGNFYGMWYVSVTIVLYILYPLLHRFLFQNKHNYICLCILGLVYFVIRVVLEQFIPSYYCKIDIGFDQVFMFIMGCETMFIIKREKRIPIYLLSIPLLLVVLFRLLLEYNTIFKVDFDMCRVIVCILLFCSLMMILARFKCFCLLQTVFKWFGQYSLELYIVHLLLYFTLTTVVTEWSSQALPIAVAIGFAIILCKPLHIFTDKVSNYILPNR